MLASADTTVVLADKPGVARVALAVLIADAPAVALVGEATTLEELRAIVRDERPDVVVVDDRLVRDAAPSTDELGARLIVTGVDDDPAYVARACRLGAEAWVPKERADELLPALLHPALQARSAA